MIHHENYRDVCPAYGMGDSEYATAAAFDAAIQRGDSVCGVCRSAADHLDGEAYSDAYRRGFGAGMLSFAMLASQWDSSGDSLVCECQMCRVIRRELDGANRPEAAEE